MDGRWSLRDHRQRIVSNLLQGQLSAGGHDVAASRISDESRDAALDQNFAELLDGFRSGLPEGQLALQEVRNNPLAVIV